MPPTAALLQTLETSVTEAVAAEARHGLTSAPKSLSPWLFYDEAGSNLFELITALPEYYLTRTERDIFTTHANDIFDQLEAPAPVESTYFHTSGVTQSAEDSANSQDPRKRSVILSAARSAESKDLRLSLAPPPVPSLTIIELGAGTAAKTGILLRALTRRQSNVLYQPVDISPTALDEARAQLESAIPNVTVRPQVANYVTGSFQIERGPHTRILALYIGSSIGNFSPAEARSILRRLRAQLQPGDALLLGTDLAPCPPDVDIPTKSVSTLLAAYNDKQGVTAAFNRNVLHRLNRELGADFRPEQFDHRALWNHSRSRIEMHLKSLTPQRVTIPANSAGGRLSLYFGEGETIHTENSYKFTPASISELLTDSNFTPARTFTDPRSLFAVTLAEAI